MSSLDNVNDNIPQETEDTEFEETGTVEVEDIPSEEDGTQKAEKGLLIEELGRYPLRCWRAVTQPSVRTFEVEKQAASWPIVVVQIILFAVVTVLPTGLGSSIGMLLAQNALVNGTWIKAFAPFVSPLGAEFLIQLVTIGLLHVIARRLGGQGSFLQVIYSSLLFIIPLVLWYILAQMLATHIAQSMLNPMAFDPKIQVAVTLVSWLGSILMVYALILESLMLVAVHRLSERKAFIITIGVALILIPLISGLLLTAVQHL